MTLLDEMHKLAESVHNRYIFGGSAPPGYDCSGSIWAALKELDPVGMATVGRFYTWNLVDYLASDNCKGTIKQIFGPQKNAIVLWDGSWIGNYSEGHVGVCNGSGDSYFSFYNTARGALNASIAGTMRAIPHKFYTYTPAQVPVTPPKPPTPYEPHQEDTVADHGSTYFAGSFTVGTPALALPTKAANLYTFTDGAGRYAITCSTFVQKVDGGVTLQIGYQDFDSQNKPVGKWQGLGSQTATTAGALQVNATAQVGAPKAGLQRRFRVMAWSGKSATVARTAIYWTK